MYVCLRIYAHESKCPEMSGEGIRCPWARITCSCEAPNSAGNWTSKPYLQPWITLSFKLSQIIVLSLVPHYRTQGIFFPDSTNTLLFLASLTFAHYFYNVINILLNLFSLWVNSKDSVTCFSWWYNAFCYQFL